ncbi:MAG TPA: aldo/keto reductase [Candidatus Krumholzibacterium sp.]|nr:aldo/keto reductase [Candidatus Krumholzibacterium sp.]
MRKNHSEMSRRGFLSAIGGIAGAGLLCSGPLGVRGATGPEDKVEGEIIHRTLGKTGLSIPVVSMGVMNADNPEVVRASYEAGVRHFDTAAYYQAGNNERMVGRVVREMGIRDDVVIATKIYTPDMRSGDSAADTRRKMLAQIDESLDRLQMDHVDILYVHNIKKVEEIENEAIIGTMKEIRKSGKTRHIGVSIHQDLHQFMDAAVRTGEYEVILTALNMTMWDYSELLASIDNAARNGIGIIAMKTQAGSQRRSRLEISDRFKSSTVATAALKWALRIPGVTTAIPGYTTFEHMREDFSVARGLDFDESEKELLSECDVKLGMGYCRQCGVCRATCPRGAEIPTLMRTHMYAARYSNFHHARLTLEEAAESDRLDRCIECPVCTASCIHSVDIAAGIEELKLIYG